jgi:very-short-patch-repair endonuclease
LKADDLRRQLIEHAQDPARLMRALEEKENRAQSEFEREVMKRLLAAGYSVAPQWRVGAFRIDLVVEGEGRRLAIECDGDRYHQLEKIPEDMDRQSVLERMGWIFTRIRGTEFLRNPDRAMKQVFEKLELLEISPANPKKEPTKLVKPSTDLIERVIRRAEELRRAWASPETTSAPRQTSSQAARQATVS